MCDINLEETSRKAGLKIIGEESVTRTKSAIT